MAATLVLLAMVLSSCGQSAPASKAVGGTMQLRITADWTLDFQANNAAPGRGLSLALYDRLVALDPKGKILPYIAQSWSTTATSATFKIRSDVVCADGTPLTATVVANSFKKYFVVGKADALRQYGPGPWTVSADDASRTFSLSLGTPYNDAIYGFTQAGGGIMCPAGLTADPKQLMDKSFGSGPFVIESLTHGDSIAMKVRPEWKWGPFGLTPQTAGFPQKLIYRVVQNETTAANLLLTGALDVARVDGPDVRRLQTAAGLTSRTQRPFFLTSMVMNEAPGHPTADETVRKALMTAVASKDFAQTCCIGLGQIGTSFFSADWNCYEPATKSLVPQPSSDQAKTILQSAGYTIGANGRFQKDGKSLMLKFVTQGIGAGPEYIAAQFEKAGIPTDLQVRDVYTANQITLTGNWDVSLAIIQLVAPSPSVIIGNFSGPPPPEGSNNYRILDSTLQQEITAAEGATGSERCAHWRNVQRQLVEKHHLLPLVAPDYLTFSRRIDAVPFGAFVEPASLQRRAS